MKEWKYSLQLENKGRNWEHSKVYSFNRKQIIKRMKEKAG